MSDIIGTSAGTIWEYLDKHGPTTVAKLIRETEVDEKTIQRGIGWLAQEGKVTIEFVNRAETIALK
ncbi:MAG TPA: winged helix-turn-helix domain-containing protein [Methylobacter sp.]|jgi:DeoR/GlpR family transcriptional regulator of sugar metabolism